MPAVSERSETGSRRLPVLRADERFVEALADVIAERVAERLAREGSRDDDAGYLDADQAAHHISATRRRIYELTSSGALRPDGYDGRRPLFKKSTLNVYVEGESGE